MQKEPSSSACAGAASADTAMPTRTAERIASNGVALPPLPVPVNRPVQRRRSSFAPLLKSQVQRREDAVGVDDAVYREPPQEAIAAAPFAVPAEATFGRVVEGVALKIGVVAGRQLTERVHGLEIAVPPLRSTDCHGQVALIVGGQGYRGRLRGVRVGLTLPDVVPNVAAQVHEVAGRRCRSRGRLPEVPRN